MPISDPRDGFFYPILTLMIHSYIIPILKRMAILFKEIKRIYPECEGRIEKTVPRITVWHQETCRVMTNGDPDGRIFLSYPRLNNGFFFLLTNRCHILKKKLPELPEYAVMRHVMMTSL